MSLARRIDYEAARALEWRGGALAPLHGAAAVEAELAAELVAGRATDAVVERARRLLRSPGDRAVAWLAVGVLLLLLLAAGGGVQVARLALGDPAEGPVNIVWFLGHALGLQTVFLLLTVLVTLGDRTPFGRLLSRTLSLGGLAIGAAVRLAARRLGGGGEGPGGEVLERLRGLSALRPLALSASHGAWTSFNVGLIAAAALILSAEHHAFGWQSTLVRDEARAEAVLRALTLPAAAWPGAASREQVLVSRYDPEARVFLTDLGEPAAATRLRQAWSLQLLAAVAGYGLLPRALLLLLCWLAWRWARRRLDAPSGDPYAEAVLCRLAPPVTTETGPPVPVPPTEADPARREDGRDGPATRHVAAWLSAAEGRSLAELVGGAGWRELPRLDSRAGERAALEAMERPAELALFCDWATTPDASLERWLHRAAPRRTWILLTGGAAFRATRRGAEAERLRARRATWERAAARCGVAAEDLLDFDADSATPESRAALRARLNAAGEAPAPVAATGLAAALHRIRSASPRWQESLTPLTGAELEAEQLRAAARIRAEVEACFENLPERARVGGAVVRLAKTALRGSLEAGGLREEAWSQALGEAARLGRLLARVREVDPRWAGAGLGLGLVAGPLGGAIAAGSAGLVAGASLAGTLGLLGTALGSALSMKRRGGEGAAAADGAERAETHPEDDRLGLPARAGVLRALELELQGCGEEELARRLGALLAGPAGRASLDLPEDVRALCEAAERAAVDETPERGSEAEPT